MRLAALTLGAWVPGGDFSGRILEVHGQACLLAVSEETCLTLAAAARRAMPRLIGLGEGRTPAGDDYLVGYAAGVLACGDNGPPADFTATLLGDLRLLAARTNRVSRLYLQAAASGEVSQRLHRVAAAIAGGHGGAGLARALAEAFAAGHSSGATGVLGLLHGSAAGSGCAARP